MSIDAQTRDVVQTIYIRKVEKVAGEPQNVEFDKVDNVKDPAGARRSRSSAALRPAFRNEIAKPPGDIRRLTVGRPSFSSEPSAIRQCSMCGPGVTSAAQRSRRTPPANRRLVELA